MRASAHVGSRPWSSAWASPLTPGALCASYSSACFIEGEMHALCGPCQGPEAGLSCRLTTSSIPLTPETLLLLPAPANLTPATTEHISVPWTTLGLLLPSSPGRATGPDAPSCKALEGRGTKEPRDCPGLGSLTPPLFQIPCVGLSLLDHGVPKVPLAWGAGGWFSPGLF